VDICNQMITGLPEI